MAAKLMTRAIPVTRKRSVEWRYGRALSALREVVATSNDELTRSIALMGLNDCGAPSDPEQPKSSSAPNVSSPKSVAAAGQEEGEFWEVRSDGQTVWLCKRNDDLRTRLSAEPEPK